MGEQKYAVTIRQEAKKEVYVQASSKSEARDKARRGEWDDSGDWSYVRPITAGAAVIEHGTEAGRQALEADSDG